MADVRVDRPTYVPPVGVPGASEERPRQQREQGEPRRDGDERAHGGREELAVALDEGGRSLSAHPDELRTMAEQTGLPSGLLFQART